MAEGLAPRGVRGGPVCPATRSGGQSSLGKAPRSASTPRAGLLSPLTAADRCLWAVRGQENGCPDVGSGGVRPPSLPPPACCTPAHLRWPSGERHFLEEQEDSPSLSLDSCLLKTRIQSGKVLASWGDPEGNEVGPGLQDRSHQSLKQTLLGRPPQLTAAQGARPPS